MWWGHLCHCPRQSDMYLQVVTKSTVFSYFAGRKSQLLYNLSRLGHVICMIYLCDLSVWSICMIYPHDLSVWSICMIYHFKLPYPHDLPVWSICMIYPRDLSVWSICMIYLCDLSASSICMIYLYDLSVWSICMIYLYDLFLFHDLDISGQIYSRSVWSVWSSSCCRRAGQIVSWSCMIYAVFHGLDLY